MANRRVDRLRIVIGRVFDAEAAAQVQLADLIAQFALHVANESHHDLRRQLEGLVFKDLGADVAVHACDMNMGKAQRLLDDRHGLSVFQSHAEFGIDFSSFDKVVRMGVDARLDAEGNVRYNADLARKLINQRQLLMVIHDKTAHIRLQRQSDFRLGLIISVEIYPGRWEILP